MITISETEISDNIETLWSATTNGPVTVLRAGNAVAVVLSPTEFAKLTARRRGIKAGFGKHLFQEST